MALGGEMGGDRIWEKHSWDETGVLEFVLPCFKKDI